MRESQLSDIFFNSKFLLASSFSSLTRFTARVTLNSSERGPIPKQASPAITLAWIAGLALLTTASACATLSVWIAYRSQRS